ncbi:transporter substrate-binding domain-containing protein [Leeia oryzae]|uniref:transporter substrate-binding domain-containing protein n=1 Tax=Leeia oryzae TaxID=356662 RepID=UPI00035D5B5A|nr:transporter substrate-binding domain-containing protein [Leeia oryzae]
MNKTLKATLISCLVSTTLLAAPAMASKLKIGIAAEPYPPFSVKQSSGQWSGFEIDLVNYICKEIKAQCEINEVAWDGIIPALTSNKIDVIFNSMSITAEREKTIAFSAPYYYTPSMYVGPKGSKLTTTPAGLKGKIIGVQGSTSNADFLKKNYSSTATIKYYNTQDELNADMAAGRVDVMLMDAVPAVDFLQSKDGAALEAKGMAPKDPLLGEGIGAGLRKSDVALKKQFDAAIKKMQVSGDFKKIQKKYFSIDLTPK